MVEEHVTVATLRLSALLFHELGTYEGTCMIMYPTYRMLSRVLNSWPLSFKSVSNPRNLAALIRTVDVTIAFWT